MRRLVCLIGALALTAGAAGASTVTSGLRGTVLGLPGGACLDDCTNKPLPSVTLVFSAPGRAVARTVTRSDGSFRVRLAPGPYAVRLGTGMEIRPSRAVVPRGRFAIVRFIVGNAKVP